MTNAATLALALLIDAFAGEPRWLWSRLPHPAVLMGRAVDLMDKTFNKGENRKRAGIVSFAALCLSAAAFGMLVTALPGGWIIELILAAILLAQKSLADHVSAVADALRLSTSDGRRAVARIVGRDTSNMDDAAISRAAIESAAENFSDGVVAPAFWFLIGGLPGLLIYKITNTADSMIGYRTERHQEFGWAAARFDDLLNWVPARLTALMIALASLRPDAAPTILRDAKLHRSPNAGWPEAAMAVVLDVALAGPRSYGGVAQHFPFVNPEGRRDAGVDDIDAAVEVLWRVWAVMTAIVALIAVA